MPKLHQRFKFTGWNLENRAILIASFSILPRSFSNPDAGKDERHAKIDGGKHPGREGRLETAS
jgi:hypothetical protein